MFDRFGVVFRVVSDAQMDSRRAGPIMLIGPLGPPGRSLGCLGPLRWSSWDSGSVFGYSEAPLGSFWCAPGAVWVLLGAYFLLGGARFLCFSCLLFSAFFL